MKFDKKYITGRFAGIVIVALLICVAIIWRAMYTATVERDGWLQLGAVKVSDPKPMAANRGNIFSADGQLIASSVPNYRAYVDFLSGIEWKDSVMSVGDTVRVFNPKQMHEKDSMWLANMDTICSGLAQICTRYTKEEYREHLMKGLELHKRYWEVCPRVVLSFVQFYELTKLPIFCMKNRNRSGLVPLPLNNRNKPFGSLAKRTLGEVYDTLGTGRSGLELAYDSLLRGVPGVKHHEKVLAKFLDIVDQEPVDGYDLVSTIDVGLQDICEGALREKMNELDANMGVVILMEVKTGDVKAIVNLQRYDDGKLYEGSNFALAALMEPGSTFKTASIMVALDDGYITPTMTVDTGCGVYNMYGAMMKDHNWHRGGYGVIDVPHVLMYSSNVGVSRLVDKYYHNQPEKFVEGLRRIGIGAPLGLPFAGAPDPRIRMPHKDRLGGYRQSDNWSATALPWMSIGYETQIPPISTVTFYNAIANGGKMVRPRFVTGIERNGELVESFPVEVIKKSICKESTLKDIQTILKRVVCDPEGLGKKAGNPYFHVSGKTGTAQVSNGSGGYKSGKNEHLVSFCGYYPSENPRYTCIVAIRHSYYVASGGGQAGVVFSKIAQRVYSKNVTTNLKLAQDTTAVFVPDVKSSYNQDAGYVLSELGINERKQITLPQYGEDAVPDVKGLGARDAVYELAARGLKVRTKGCGVVTRQSIAAGAKLVKGETIVVELN